MSSFPFVLFLLFGQGRITSPDVEMPHGESMKTFHKQMTDLLLFVLLRDLRVFVVSFRV
jgi:hypothetical protein